MLYARYLRLGVRDARIIRIIAIIIHRTTVKPAYFAPALTGTVSFFSSRRASLLPSVFLLVSGDISTSLLWVKETHLTCLRGPASALETTSSPTKSVEKSRRISSNLAKSVRSEKESKRVSRRKGSRGVPRVYIREEAGLSIEAQGKRKESQLRSR